MICGKTNLKFLNIFFFTSMKWEDKNQRLRDAKIKALH